MKKLLLLIFAVLISSCQSDQLNSQTEKEIALLKKENDSLKNIIQNKFLFDHIHFGIIPSGATPIYNDEEFRGRFVIIGYNKSDFVIKGDYDVQKREFSQSNKIKGQFGNYPFFVDGGTEEVSFGIELDDTFASKTYDTIITVPYQYLWPQ